MTFLLSLLTFTLCFSQTKTITGTVTDEDDMPLIGVNIIVIGTKTGTQTDFDGHYTIDANLGDTLVFSYVGFKPYEHVIGNSNSINVVLVEDGLHEDEIVYCCIPSNYLIPKFNYGLNYNTKGISIKKVFYKYNLFNPEIVLGYHTNYDDNKKLNIELNLNYLFSIFNVGTIEFHSSLTDIDIDNQYNFKTYNFTPVLSTNNLFQYETELKTGIGIGKFNKNNTEFGYIIGFKQRLPLKLSPYFTTIFWNDFQEYKTGLTWSIKRFYLEYEFHKIDTYNEHTIGLGYKLYF